MKENHRSRRGAVGLFLLMVMICMSDPEAAELKSADQRAQRPAAFKDARIGDDPDSVPQANRIGEIPSALLEDPRVTCTMVALGEDPDPIPRVWWVRCHNIGNDPDPIPPTN